MKCTKCGYVSFDYLSECKKCGIDLVTAREALGFQTAKSNVPFFLGSLLKDYVKPSATDEKHLTEDNPKSEFDFGEDFDFGGSFDNAPPTGQTIAAQTAPPSPVLQEADDFNLLDISDEELGILTMDDENERASGKGAGAALEAASRTGAPNEPGADANTLIPRFDVSSLPGLSQDPMEKSSGLGVSLDKSEVQPEMAIDENLVIDLSDKDLENFLSELEDSHEVENAAGNANLPPSSEKR
jgi:hypothetical protein